MMFFCGVQKGIVARVETIAEGHVIIELVSINTDCIVQCLIDVSSFDVDISVYFCC